MGSPTGNHLTGDSVYVRAGGVNNSGTQTGLYSPNHAAEYSATAFGQGTEYCGEVFHHTSIGLSFISTGIGQYSQIYDYPVPTRCLSDKTDLTESAYCYSVSSSGSCPRGWGTVKTLSNGFDGCSRGTHYPNPTRGGEHSVNTGSLVLTIYHLSNNNSYVRAGGSHDTNSFQPGLFIITLEPESSDSSYGVGTAYCGRAFYATRYPPMSHISTGIGTYQVSDYYVGVSSDCQARLNVSTSYAYCNYEGVDGTCPLGWGSYDTLIAGQPGCWSGTYYPSPTQAGNHTPNTGSRYTDCL